MATVTQTKLVGFCLGNKANYNATNYANHIWFDPTNKQILLNGIEYIPKKLSELVNDSGFLNSANLKIESTSVTAVKKITIGSYSGQFYTYDEGISGNMVLASATSSDSTTGATFRKLVAADIPTLAISKISGLQAALNDKVSGTNQIYTEAPLSISGEGMLKNEPKISLNYDGATLVVDSSSHKLKVGTIAQSQVSGLSTTLAGYLPLSGGTLTGKLLISASGGGTQFEINNTNGGECYFYMQSNGTRKGAFTTNHTNYGTAIYDATSSKYLGIKADGTPHYQGNTLLHSGNYTTYAATKDHTHTFASITSKPTTLGGYGITDGLRRVTLANNVENDFNTFENLTLTGRGDPTTGSSLLNSPWTTQPAGGFGVLTYLWSGYGLQLAAGYNSNDLYVRSKYYFNGGANWSTRWDKILNSSNYSSYALPLSGGTLSGALTCNGDYINMNNDSGSRGYRGFFNQSGSANRASGSHVFMNYGQALGSNAISLGYNAFAGIRNQDADKGTYPYIAWQWMPSEKIHITINNQDTANGEFYGYEVLGGKMVQYELGGNTYTYENTSSSVRVLVCVKDDADTGLIFGGKSYMPFNATKTLIQGKYILARGESITAVNTVTVGEVNYYVLAIYTWAATVGYDYSTQVKVMCATKVNNSNYNGASSYASGSYSVASGESSVASGQSSVASGYASVASGYYSVASGYYSVASGNYSVASGQSSVASGYASVASGYASVASGSYSVASGYASVASGQSSVASGYASVASGYYSVASGYYSVASGESSVASGDFSVVLARNGETMSSYQTIIGRYNAKVAGLFIIGNGSSSARSNAFVVDDSGNVTAKYFSGYANAVGGEGFKIYPENNNQINFGGTGSDTTIVFGAASKDSRSVPTTYKFGADGKATLLGSADMLDGYHETSFMRGKGASYNLDLSTLTTNGVWSVDPDRFPTNDGGLGEAVSYKFGTLLCFSSITGSSSTIQIYQPHKAEGWWIRNSYDGTTQFNAWHQIAFTDSNVATATALTSSAGSATQPIYFSNGKPVACSYTLAKSVPSNAVFTDTTYSVATASTDGLMSSAMFKAEMVKSVSVRQGSADVIVGGSITNHSVYITQKKSNITNSYVNADGDGDVKIPNATTTYDGSMSYTDKKKLDKMPNTVFGFRLDIDDASTVSYYDPFGDYNIGGKDATNVDVNTIQTNNHYITLIAFTITNDELKNKLKNRFVKFGYSSKDSATNQTMRLLQSNFDGGSLFIEYIHTEPQYNVSFDCIWEFY